MRFLFRFLLAALLSPLAASVQDAESWNAHFQSTYVRQVQPAFRSPYAGPRSLRARPGASDSLTAAADAISSAHQAYLARGGVTAFLGDGALRYGRERVAELYYAADLGAGFTLTADAQRVADPGDNKDRGPVAFYALRLHWEV